jgi:hypothetical protein
MGTYDLRDKREEELDIIIDVGMDLSSVSS